MTPQLKTALIALVSALLGAFGGYAASPEAELVTCPECSVCPAAPAPAVEAAPVEAVPAEAAPVVAPEAP